MLPYYHVIKNIACHITEPIENKLINYSLA